MSIPTQYARLLEGRVLRLPQGESSAGQPHVPLALTFAQRRRHLENVRASSCPSGTTGRDGGEDPDYLTDD